MKKLTIKQILIAIAISVVFFQWNSFKEGFIEAVQVKSEISSEDH
jgi:hypothetical protein